MDNKNIGIKPREITEEVQQSYLAYAMSVIVARALPDVRDGLKPVHRRILYSMHEMGLRPNAKYQKSAKVVGWVLGAYHPHGDTAAYDSMVRMAQDFSLRYPLVDGQGNFGCFTGDTKVSLTDGRNLSFKELVKECKAGKKSYTYTFNHRTEGIEIAEIKNPRITRKRAKLIEVTLDNKERIRCTPDHRFMLRDGSYKEAQYLKKGDSLMPLYFRASKEILQPVFHSLNHTIKKIQFLDSKKDVYDLTVEGTHNFALAAGIFVHNSIDGDSAAAYRYCLTGDTKVVIENGLIPIKNLVNTNRKEKKVNLKVLSLARKANKVSKWFNSGIHPTLKITTSRGYSIEGSFNHPILTWVKDEITGLPRFNWKTLDKVSEGDYVVIDRSPVLWPESKVNLVSYYPADLPSRAERKILPKYLDENLASILGALVSEGTVRENEIEFCNSDRSWVSFFENIWKKTFPDCRLHKFERQPNSFGKKPYQTLEIHSRHVVRFLRNIGLLPVKSAQKEISELIFRSPKSVAAAFLRAFFEGDGSVFYAGKTFGVTGMSVNEKLIDQIQLLLLRFGIASLKRYDKSRNLYYVRINELSNYKLFKEQIGFLSERKSKILNEIIEILVKDYSQSDFVPYLSEFVRSNLIHTYGNNDFALKHNFDRYGLMKANYPSLISNIVKENRLLVKDLFTKLLDYHYLYDPVVKVERTGSKEVYSIKVDSNCHSFVANGFINHNTEARLAPVSEYLLSDIDKDTVPFRPNYDASTQEPEVLPTRIPNLLVNGSMGIAVGMATNIPPHNLGEILDSLAHLIENPDADIKELMQFVKGPDFPTAGTIYNEQDISNAYATGRGPVVMRGKAEIVEGKRGFQIIITEIPYQVNKAELIKHIADLVKDGEKIQGIRDLRDESDKDGLRIAIDLKQDAFPRKVLNQLFKYTELQKTFHFNMLGLVDGIQPQILGLKHLLEKFIEHRREVVTRRTRFELQKAKDRAHILEGLKKALDHIDEIIKIIRASDSKEDAAANLIKKFKFSDKQTAAILEMRLQALAGLERKKIEDELKEKKELIAYLEGLLASPKKILGVIKDEFKEIKEKFGDERRTKVVKLPLKEIGEEELVPEEDSLFMLTQSGYIKRLPPDAVRAQKRGGKGLVGMATKEEDVVSQFFLANTHDDILFFTNSGKVFKTKGYEVPESSRQSKGKAIVNFLQVTPSDVITAVVPVPKEQKGEYLFMATRKGIIKKVDMDALGQVRRNGMIAIKLHGDDELGWVVRTSSNDHIIMTTSGGNAIRFKEKDVRPMGRNAAGVIGVRVDKDEKVVGVNVIPAGAEKGLQLLAVMENGYGKRTDIKAYKLQKRGGKGIMTAKITSKTGKLVSAHITSEENKELIAVSRKGVVIRTSVESISVLGRATQGVRIMKVEPADKLASVVLV